MKGIIWAPQKKKKSLILGSDTHALSLVWGILWTSPGETQSLTHDSVLYNITWLTELIGGYYKVKMRSAMHVAVKFVWGKYTPEYFFRDTEHIVLLFFLPALICHQCKASWISPLPGLFSPPFSFSCMFSTVHPHCFISSLVLSCLPASISACSPLLCFLWAISSSLTVLLLPIFFFSPLHLSCIKPALKSLNLC